MANLEKAIGKMPKAKQTEIDEGMTSAGRLEQMTSKDSPLMQRAQTQGRQYAAGRGLINSSIAAEASQGAMIDRAQPFALQDSSQLIETERQNTAAQNQFGLQEGQLRGESYLGEQQHGFQRDLGQQQFGFQKQLGQQQFGFQKQLTQQQANIQKQRDQFMRKTDLEMARVESQLAEARAQGDFNRAKILNEKQANLQLRRDRVLSDLSIRELGATSSANAWGVMANNTTDIVSQALEGIANIQANPDIKPEDKTKMIKQLTDMRDADINFQKSLYQNLRGFLKNTGMFPSL